VGKLSTYDKVILAYIIKNKILNLWFGISLVQDWVQYHVTFMGTARSFSMEMAARKFVDELIFRLTA
jgi:hypothetical protein